MSFFKNLKRDFKIITNEDKTKVKPISKQNYLIIKWFFRLYWLFDIFVLSLLYFVLSNTPKTIVLVLILTLIGYNIYLLFLYWKGNANIDYNLHNYRTQCAEGDQGIGKSSFIKRLARRLKKRLGKDTPIVCNNAFIMDNEFCCKLTKDAFTMKVQLPEKTVQIVEEITIYYNNLDTSKNREEIAGTEANFQFVRHNTNGYILADSVAMGRVLKPLEEKFGLTNYILGQKSIKTGFIIPFIYWIMRKFNKKLPHIYWGYRRWKIQTFLSINKDGYIYDLSNDTANSKANKFVNLFYYYDFNDYSIIYDDRTYSELYKTLPKKELKNFSSLTFSKEDVKDTGFDALSHLYDIQIDNSISKGLGEPRKRVDQVVSKSNVSICIQNENKTDTTAPSN